MSCGAAPSARRARCCPTVAASAGGQGDRSTSSNNSSTSISISSTPHPPPPLHAPLGLVLFSSAILGVAGWLDAATAAAASPSCPSSFCSPPAAAAFCGLAVGALLGGAYAALGRHARQSLWRLPARPLRVVISGGTRGLGKALAREMLAAGDAVAITGRAGADGGGAAVARAVRELPAEAVALLRASGADVGEREERAMRARLAGFVCDVAAEDGGASVEGALDKAAAFFAAAAAGAGGGNGGGGVGGDDSGARPSGFDVLICNAGASGGARRLFPDAAAAAAALDENQGVVGDNGSGGDSSDDDDTSPASATLLRDVVRTNLLGALRCAKAGMGHLSPPASSASSSSSPPSSSARGHLFFVDGAGSDGGATPLYSAYGATKAALPQLAASLRAELKAGAAAAATASAAAAAATTTTATTTTPASSSPRPTPQPPSVHVLSPGMMLTDLLLRGSPVTARSVVFNALAEHPETAAAFLAPRVRSAVARGADATYPKYLTPWSALARFARAPLSRGRFFDAAGEPVYLPERERLLGKGARATARARRGAAVASRLVPLRAAYSASLLACALGLGAALGGGGGSVAAAQGLPPAAAASPPPVVVAAAAAVAPLAPAAVAVGQAPPLVR